MNSSIIGINSTNIGSATIINSIKSNFIIVLFEKPTAVHVRIFKNGEATSEVAK